MTSFSQRFAPLLMLLAVPTCGYSQDDANNQSQTAVTVVPTGVRRYEPGAWSALSLSATNETDADKEEFVSVYIGKNNSHLQFARRFWLPAGSKRQTFVPVLIPKASSANPYVAARLLPQTDAFYMRLKDDGTTETFESNSKDTNIRSQPLQLDYDEVKSGILFRKLMPDESGRNQEIDWDTYDMAHKAKESATKSRVLIDFGADFVPPYPNALNSLDQMIMSGDRILNDSAGLANLRHWLQQGGRLWITLDTTSMETVTALLGNEAQCCVVDRVELNDFELENWRGVLEITDEPEVESWSEEIPVEMLKVFAGTDDVQCRIDGWPVAFWQKVGDGEVLFTTLGPRGWLKSGEATFALGSIGQRFFQPREVMVVDPEAVRSLLEDQIGYRIPSRRLAAWILGLNSLGILALGCWWARQHQLERLAWFVPVMAGVASSVFLVIGSRNTASIPSTVASGQIVRVSKATNESHVSAISAVYSQEAGKLAVVAKSGAMAVPSNREARGAIKRVVWDDDGQSQWVNLPQPGGVVRHLDATRTVSHSNPPAAHGTFDASGFHGTLTGLKAGQCEDAVIVSVPAPAAAVSLDAEGNFDVGAGDVLAYGQYIADGLMSEKQRSRQQLLRKLLVSSSLNPFGSEPSVLAWTPPVDIGVEFDASFEQLGSALTSIPLQIERPPSGTDVLIPATFIRIKSYFGRQGASSMFNQQTGKWIENANKATRSQIRCVVPAALVPLQISRATVTVKINAPSRSLRIEGMVGDEMIVLHERANPNGVLRFEIDRPEALELDADSGFHLTVVVTETDKQREIREGQAATVEKQFDNSTWQIDYVSVDAEGTVR